MKRWWWILPVLLLLFASQDADAARAPMVNVYTCALAADGTGCLGDHPLAGGACDTGTCTALAANDKAILITTTCAAFYTYTTGTAATTTGACPSIIRPPDYSSAGNWVRTAVTDSVGTATDSAAGIAELATDAETVTGSATNRVTTPANITARLAAPGAIGGTTPAAGTFTSVTVAKQSGVAGENCVYEATTTETSKVCVRGPASRSSDLSLQYPDADPSGVQVLGYDTPAAGVSTGTWVTPATAASTTTFTNKTLDVDGTGNVLKQWVYIPILGSAFKKLGSSITAPATTVTASNYGLPKFSNSADKANNFVDFILPVPPDIDTSVDLTATLQFMLGGADTGDFEYILSMVSIAASGAVAGTPGNAVSFAYTADASGADGDYEVTAELTLTNWRSNVTAGNLWLIRLERDGDHANDSSTVDSYPLVLTIKYKSTQ